jgi:hypothetical protein
MQHTYRMIVSAVAAAALSGFGVAQTHAAWALLDNFDSYPAGGIGATPNTTGNVWVGVFDGTGAAYVVDNGGGNKAIANYGSSGSGGWRGIEANLTTAFGADYSVPDVSVATFFYQFNPTSIVRNAGSDGPDWDQMMGLTDNVGAVDQNDSWQDYAVMPFFAGAAATPAMYNNSGTYGTLSLDTWHNLWIVVDTTANTYDLYMSTGTADGTLINDDAAFINSKGATALQAIAFMSHSDNETQFDNLYYSAGVDTTNPVPEPGNVLLLGVGATAMLRRRRGV